jgi:CRAL/TRIO domain
MCWCSARGDEGTRSAPANDNENAATRRRTEEEKKLAKSIYHDARQSLTGSMVYRPAASAIYPTNFSLDESPDNLMSKKGRVQDSVVVKENLQHQDGLENQPGYPGSLTPKELEACLEFRQVLKKRQTEDEPTYYDMVHFYGDFEPEAFALCRFMRARNFNVKDTLQLMNGNIETWNVAAKENFYKDLQMAMGCPLSILRTQLPLLLYGIAKNGSLVAYFQVERVSLEALDCMTDLENFVKYIWNTFGLVFINNATIAQKKFPDTTILGELTIVIDLKGISRSLFTDRVMTVLKNVIKVLNCFPEALNKLIIVNAPFFFSAIWLVFKQLLDARTAQKVDIYANAANGLACIQQHIRSTELCSDYGGNGPSMAEILNEMREPGTTRQIVERIFLNPRGESGFAFRLDKNEKATVIVSTRSAKGAQFMVADKNSSCQAFLVHESALPARDCIRTSRAWAF